MWLVARYLPVALFSLRASTATTSGARTNLVPTMYAIKLALVDAVFRAGADGAEMFELVKSIAIRLEPPDRTVVSNTFIKVLREPKDTKTGPAFISSIAYREFCYLDGELGIAFWVDGIDQVGLAMLTNYLSHINYFGKRGSFFQFKEVEHTDALSPSFGYVANDDHPFSRDVILQYLDDLAPEAIFDRLNTYSDTPARLGRDRILVPVALPYRRVAASRGYTLYERSS